MLELPLVIIMPLAMLLAMAIEGECMGAAGIIGWEPMVVVDEVLGEIRGMAEAEVVSGGGVDVDGAVVVGDLTLGVRLTPYPGQNREGGPFYRRRRDCRFAFSSACGGWARRVWAGGCIPGGKNIAIWQGEEDPHPQIRWRKVSVFIFLVFHWRMDWPDCFFRWGRHGEEKGEAPNRRGPKGT